MNQLIINRNEVTQGPSGQCMAAIRRLRRDHACQYLDGYYASILIPKLAERFGHPPEQILTSYGEEDFFRTVLDRLDPREDSVLTHELHYSYHDKYLAFRGIKLHVFRMEERDGEFGLDIEDCLRQYETYRPRLVMITSPNNPTGNAIPPRDLERIVSGVGRETLVLLDEAYFGFDPGYDEAAIHRLLRERRNLIVLRTFSKLYALAGLRVAFALCGAGAKEILRYQDRYLGMSRVLEEAAIAALESDGYYRGVARRIVEDREWFVRQAADLRLFRAYRSKANFVCVKVDERLLPAVEAVLARERVVIAKFVGEHLLRVSVGRPRFTRAFFQRLEEIDAAWARGRGSVRPGRRG